MIARLADSHPVRDLCWLLGVSRSSYYAWRRRGWGRRAREDQALGREIKRIHEESRRSYGTRRVAKALGEEGRPVGRRRVGRLMKQQGLRGVQKGRYRPRTTRRDPEAAPAPNRLASVEVVRPNQVLVADITYLAVRGGWTYLAAVMDLYSRRIAGWALSERMPAELVVEAFERAVTRRPPPPGLIHHSDHGSQYTGGALRQALASWGALGSMGQTGVCYDNAAMESFWSTLKAEAIAGRVPDSPRELHGLLFDYIETFYNTRRLHSALGYQSPAVYETQYVNLLSTPRCPEK